MSETQVQVITKDDLNNFKENLLYLDSDIYTSKEIHINKDLEPVLQDSVSVLNGQLNNSNICELLTSDGNRITVPVANTYMITFDVLCVLADFSVCRWFGKATVQNTGGVVSGVGPIYYFEELYDENLLSTHETMTQKDWGLNGLDIIWQKPTGPGQEDNNLEIGFDTDSDNGVIKLFLRSADGSDYNGLSVQATLNVQKAINNLASAYSSSSPATPIQATIPEVTLESLGSQSPRQLLYYGNNMFALEKTAWSVWTSIENPSPLYVYFSQLNLNQRMTKHATEGRVYVTEMDGGNYNGGLWTTPLGESNKVILHSFTPETEGLIPSYIEYSSASNRIYGVCMLDSGPSDGGKLWSCNADGSDFVIHHHFGSVQYDGFAPNGLGIKGDIIHGVCTNGGTSGFGTYWTYDSYYDIYTTRKHFEFEKIHGPAGVISFDGGIYTYITCMTGPYYSAGHGGIIRVDDTFTNYDTIHEFNFSIGSFRTGVIVGRDSKSVQKIFGATDKMIYSLSMDGSTFTPIAALKNAFVLGEPIIHQSKIYVPVDTMTGASGGAIVSASI